MLSMQLYFLKRSRTWGIRLSRGEAPPHGKFISLRNILGRPVTSEAEARRVFAIYKEERLKETLIRLQHGRTMQLQELKKEFPAARPGLSGDTLRMDRLAIQQLIDVAGKTKQVRAIVKADLQRMANACQARGLSVASIAAYLRHLRAALNWCVEAGYLQEIPKFPALPHRRRLPRAIPSRHLQEILQWSRKHNRDLWRMAAFAACTGCRRREILGITGRDVELYQCPTMPVVGRARIIGKGDAERTVPLLVDVLPAIEPLPHIGPVFKQVHPDTVSHWFAEAVASCGFADANGKTLYNFHGLRHSFGAILVQRGAHIRAVQAIMGHSDVRVTEIYSELTGSAIEAELGRVW